MQITAATKFRLYSHDEHGPHILRNAHVMGDEPSAFDDLIGYSHVDVLRRRKPVYLASCQAYINILVERITYCQGIITLAITNLAGFVWFRLSGASSFRHQNHAGHDQVGALDFRAAVRAVWSDACRWRGPDGRADR